MKNVRLLLFFFFSFLISTITLAQKGQPLNVNVGKLRCGTMEAIDVYFKKNPQAKVIAEQNKNISFSENKPAENSRTNAIVTIPVVVHLVLSSADQALVTNADVLWQINRMNEDYSGINADSANGASFFS
ncbi:MAG TPA: hypothetical protein VM888_09050, partial [Chitinophagaceae bacterium]|nr:hypothetical protein [Chitinophagaceae bacterium]